MARIKRQQMKKQAKYTDTMLMELGLKSNKDKNTTIRSFLLYLFII
jgi:hypothetical protein